MSLPLPSPPAGQATCGDTYNALTAANLQKAMASGSLNIAGVELTRVGDGDDEFNADFVSFPVNSLVRSYGGVFGPSIGSCLAYEIEGSSLVLTDPIKPSFLDAGSQLMITGPSGVKTVNATSTGYFSSTLASASPFYIAPGNYTVANGAGGVNVAAFNWALTLPPSVVPNVPASINRSQNLTLTWTGGSAFPVVSVLFIQRRKSHLDAEILCRYHLYSGGFGRMTFTASPPRFTTLLPGRDGFGTPTTAGVSIRSWRQLPRIISPWRVRLGSTKGFFTAFIANGAVATIQ